ncbi:hypothetical protein STEG23_020949, partial [Scotinomys teguina]
PSEFQRFGTDHHWSCPLSLPVKEKANLHLNPPPAEMFLVIFMNQGLERILSGTRVLSGNAVTDTSPVIQMLQYEKERDVGSPSWRE